MERLNETNKTLIFTEEQVESLLFFKYGQKYTFSVLSLIYPYFDYKNRFHQDHIFPKSFFTRKRLSKKGISADKIEFYLENYNYIGNLQLLEGIPNEEKSSKDYKEWLETNYPDIETRKEYSNKHFIPDTRLEFDNFEEFFNKRYNLIKKKLKNLLIP